jgi:hypothetical protein
MTDNPIFSSWKSWLERLNCCFKNNSGEEKTVKQGRKNIVEKVCLRIGVMNAAHADSFAFPASQGYF